MTDTNVSRLNETIIKMGGEIANLQIENAELKKELDKLRYELNCNAWFNVWKDEVKFRLEEVYNRNDISQEVIEKIAKRMTVHDRVSEEVCDLVDSFLEDEGIEPKEYEEDK